jgi:hypothetical protein
MLRALCYILSELRAMLSIAFSVNPNIEPGSDDNRGARINGVSQRLR